MIDVKLKNGWQRVNLSDLGRVERGRSRHRPRNDKVLFGGKYPFIQTGDVKSANLYINSYSQTYNENGLAQSKLWQSNTLCITIAANIADSAILAIPACFPDSIVGFIPYEKKSDVKFVKYLLDLLQKNFQLISKGTTQDNLSLEKLLSINFSAPHFKTQQKIASILSAFDDLIENNTKRIKILENTAQLIYKEWFVDFKFPGHEQVKIVDSGTEFGEIPEGWEVGCIGNLYKIKSGFAFKSKDFGDSGNPIIKIKNLNENNTIDLINVNRVSNEFVQKADKFKLTKRDILIAMTGATIGKFGIMPLAKETFYVNQRVGKFFPKKESLNNCFIYCVLPSEFVQKEIVNIALGAAQPNISGSGIEGIKLLIPDDDKLQKFESMIEPMVNEILLLQNKNQKLHQTRDMLLPKLVGGEVGVEDLNIQI